MITRISIYSTNTRTLASYSVKVNSGITALVQDPDDQEQIWASEYSDILPLEQDTSSPDDILRWKITQTDSDIPYIITLRFARHSC